MKNMIHTYLYFTLVLYYIMFVLPNLTLQTSPEVRLAPGSTKHMHSSSVQQADVGKMLQFLGIITTMHSNVGTFVQEAIEEAETHQTNPKANIGDMAKNWR